MPKKFKIKNLKQRVLKYQPIITTIAIAAVFALFGFLQLTLATTIGTNISTDGYLTVSGNVGIGTTSPWALLSVNAPAGQPSFAIGSSSATSFIVDKSGNVGIGTTSPGTNLDIFSATERLLRLERSGVDGWEIGIDSTTGSIDFFNDATSTAAYKFSYDWYGGNAIGPRFVVQGPTFDRYSASEIALNSTDTINHWYLAHRGDKTIGHLDKFMILGSQGANWIYPFTIDLGGNVGIGTTTPSETLTISNGFNVFDSTSPYDVLIRGYDSSDDGILDIYADNSVTARIHGNGASYFNGGNVGIGTTSPWAKLSVAVVNSNTSPLFTISTSTASATSTAFLIDSNGNVGIATTSPAAALAVNGLMYIGGAGTSTIQSNLYVQGTLRSAISYNGDLIFANMFRITEATGNAALLFNNSNNQTILSLDENGVAEVKEIKAEKARLGKLEMIDEDTGDIWCVKIKSGEWQKKKGGCQEP